MKVLLTGEGARAAELLAVMTAHRGTSVTARVSRDGTGANLPVHRTVESALSEAAADAVVLTGDIVPAVVVAVAAGSAPILIANPAWPTAAALRELQRIAEAGRPRVLLARDEGYSSCRATLAKYVASGRLGPIGHVSIEDSQVGDAVAVDGSRHWLHRAGPLLAQACGLFGTTAQDVMARVDEANGVTEAYVTTGRNIHLHYTGRWSAAVDSHRLWIEGTGGSLVADARAVWWRKRGWRFFVPVRAGGVARATSLAASWNRLIAEAGRTSDSIGDCAALAIAVAALQSTACRQSVPAGAGAASAAMGSRAGRPG